MPTRLPVTLPVRFMTFETHLHYYDPPLYPDDTSEEDLLKKQTEEGGFLQWVNNPENLIAYMPNALHRKIREDRNSTATLKFAALLANFKLLREKIEDPTQKFTRYFIAQLFNRELIESAFKTCSTEIAVLLGFQFFNLLDDNKLMAFEYFKSRQPQIRKLVFDQVFSEFICDESNTYEIALSNWRHFAEKAETESAKVDLSRKITLHCRTKFESLESYQARRTFLEVLLTNWGAAPLKDRLTVEDLIWLKDSCQNLSAQYARLPARYQQLLPSQLQLIFEQSQGLLNNILGLSIIAIVMVGTVAFWLHAHDLFVASMRTTVDSNKFLTQKLHELGQRVGVEAQEYLNAKAIIDNAAAQELKMWFAPNMETLRARVENAELLTPQIKLASIVMLIAGIGMVALLNVWLNKPDAQKPLPVPAWLTDKLREMQSHTPSMRSLPQ